MSPSTSYRRGDSGGAVAEIRGRLVALGLLAVDGRGEASRYDDRPFDEAMDVAVREFQQQRGITVDGIVGVETFRVLEEARWRLGDRILSYSVSHLAAGDDVAALQRRLMEMGFDCGRVDGILGRQTDVALREFQRNVGLPPDGTCGPSTFKALERLVLTVTGGSPHAMREETALTRSGPAMAGKTVIIDPGHGGADRGITAHGLTEAEVVEDLAARIEGRLVATGVRVFPTRSRGVAPDDSARAAFANAAAADLVVSLHVDGHVCAEAQGVATYYYGNDRHGHGSAVGERFAELVQSEIVARTDLTDCRTHGRTWDLLRRTRMPTVRVELGYLTHSGDAARLADPTFRDVVAEAVVVAVSRLYATDDVLTGEIRLPELVGR